MSQVMSQGAPLVTDIAVIGAGPTGLFAVFEAGMLNMRCAVLDALDMPGGQCAALYPEKPIYDIPAQPSILAKELVDRLVTQAAPFDPVYRLGHAVTALWRRPEGGWEVENAAGERVHCRAILIAAGAGAFGPNKPPLAGIEKYEGKAFSTWYAGAKIFAAGEWSLPGAAIRQWTGPCHWSMSPSGSWWCIAATGSAPRLTASER